MSGSATYQNQLPTEQKNLAKKQAELLGCPTDTTGNMLICLNTKTVDEFINTTKEFFVSFFLFFFSFFINNLIMSLIFKTNLCFLFILFFFIQGMAR